MIKDFRRPNAEGVERLTIVIEGHHDIARFAINLLDDQSEFAAIGRRTLRYMAKRRGTRQWRGYLRYLTGREVRF